jgi:hypothetical protein
MQQVRLACFGSRQISALRVPSVLNPRGYRLDILLDCLIVAEPIAVCDDDGLLHADLIA